MFPESPEDSGKFKWLEVEEYVPAKVLSNTLRSSLFFLAALAAATPVQESSAIQLPKPPPVHDLPHLTLVKQKLIAYHDCVCDCGCSTRDLDRVGHEVLFYLKRYLRAHRIQKGRDSAGRKPAIILDIDDTALSTWDNMMQHDFAYSREEFLKWEQQANAPAIQPTLELSRFARENQVAVFFISGRPEREREVTIRGLASAGYKDWTGLIMKKPDSPRFAVDYKSAERKNFVRPATF